MDNNIFQRHELKYLVSAHQRGFIEKAMSAEMVPDQHGESTICNVYYDTPDFRLIRTSLEKPLYKEKLRIRSYGSAKADEDIFLELKKKYGGIVYKRRISIKECSAVDFLRGKKPLPDDSQIGREIEYMVRFYHDLIPAVYLSYDRTAYFSKTDGSFRVTFDNNILWRNSELDLISTPGGQQILQPSESLMEVKAGSAMPLWFVKLLDRAEIRQVSFSKYGRAYEAMCQNNYIGRRRVCCA